MIDRPCVLPQDRAALDELWLLHRVAASVEVYPTLWRLRLLLSSRVWEPDLDARIWQEDGGRIIGFAMLWRRRRESPYLVLERCLHPAADLDALIPEMLRWDARRARDIAREARTSLTLFATSQPGSALALDDPLEAFGFERTPIDDHEHNVYFVRSLGTALPEAALPAGYTLRLLQRGDDLGAYHELYDFGAVNPQHLEELLLSDEYHHLVMVNPQGVFVAYCEYSFCRQEWQRSGRRIGWIDYIGTRPEYQRQGLASALLLDSLKRLRAQGAETALLVTLSSNTPAIRLYQRAGFGPMAVPEPVSYQMNIPAEA